MLRRAAVVAALLLCSDPSQVLAQEAGFRIETDSAAVHLSPSTGSPVVGHARRGAVLEITRELGSWVRVSWPDAASGSGYVHVSTGSRTDQGAAAAVDPSLPASTHRAASSPLAESPREDVGSRASRVPHPSYVATPPHVVGLGGRFGGSSAGSGASLRAWMRDRFGVQVEILRSSVNGAVSPARLTAVHVAPSVLYALPDYVGDYVWVRPYAGAGPRFLRQTIHTGVPSGIGAESEGRLGVQAFGGAEFTFASLPSVAISGALHYGWLRNPTEGFELSGAGVSVSGHWYLK